MSAATAAGAGISPLSQPINTRTARSTHNTMIAMAVKACSIALPAASLAARLASEGKTMVQSRKLHALSAMQVAMAPGDGFAAVAISIPFAAGSSLPREACARLSRWTSAGNTNASPQAGGYTDSARRYYRTARSLALQQLRDRLHLMAGIDRQSSAERIAGVEGAFAGQHLRRHHVAQHRDFPEFFALAKNVRLRSPKR